MDLKMVPYSTLIRKRTLKPILWNLIIQTCFLSLFIFVTSADLLNPVKWFYKWPISFMWSSSLLYIGPLTVMVVFLASASTEDYLKPQPLFPNRISLLQQALTLRNLTYGWLHLSMGFLLPWVYTSLIGSDYERFRYQCVHSPDEVCFSEKRAFLVEGGMWISILHFFHSHFFGTRYLKFPIAQLPKLILVKGQFTETVKKSFQWSTMPVGSFLIIYYLKVGSLTSSVVEHLGYKIEGPRINSFSGLCDLSLLTYFMVFSVIITMTIRLMEMFSRVYLSERYHFPFYSAGEPDGTTLTESLKLSEYPIIQHLAFLDLMLLSEHSKGRRDEIYKLSNFGGHPHLWNSAKESCFEILHEFINDLAETRTLPPQFIPLEVKSQPLLRRNVPDYFAGLENKFSAPPTPVQTSMSGFASQFLERIKKSPIVVFIFGVRKDMKIRHTLRLSLPVKWACESLSFLASYSVKEDKYGVVVNDLPLIIQHLLQLKQSLETLLKQTSLATTLSTQDIENLAQATALKKSVKRSIYRIVDTFKNYISDLKLTKEVESQLMPYILYKD